MPHRRRIVGAVIRYRLVRLLPFLARWIEVTPAACCGVCPTCIGTAAGALLLPMVFSRRDED
jgi:hypothetical protein